MPTHTDYPSGVAAENDWGLEGVASKLLAMSGDDADAGIVYADSGGRHNIERYTFPPLLGVTDPVTAASITAKVREAAPGAGGRSFYFHWNSVVGGTNFGSTIHAARPSYVTPSRAAAGGELALAAVNGEHGFEMYAAGGPSQKWEVWCTLCYRSVTFTYAGGSADHFGHLIGSVIGAIGAGLLLREMPALARAIRRKTGTLILPHEYETALLAWQRERHMAVA